MESTSQNEGGLDKTSQNMSTTPKKGPGRDPQLVSRDEMMARADEFIAAEREAEYRRFLESSDSDPRAAALAAAMDKESKGEALDVDRGHRDLTKMGGEAEPAAEVDGAAAVQPMVAAPKARPAERISTKGEDPLGDFVVRVDGKPMFKTVVDGQERLIPLEKARQELQISLAAGIRFDQARALKAQAEAELTRARSVHPAAARPAAPAIDDRKLASELVRSLVSEPEDKAAAKMAETFAAIRQSAAPQIDTASVMKLARDEAQKTIADERKKEAFGTGFEQFTKNYPDIAADSDLFKVADAKSDVIAAEHPDWAPHQIMDEAGKQTRAWMTSLGVTVKAAPTINTQGNQQRKQTLVPMPQPRSAAPAPAAEDSDENSPQAELAAIRKSRGQPY